MSATEDVATEETTEQEGTSGPDILTYAVRVVNWTEWLPRTPDASSEGQPLANGSSHLQVTPSEKLAEINVQPVNLMGQPAIVTKRCIFHGDTMDTMEVLPDEEEKKEGDVSQDDKPKIELPEGVKSAQEQKDEDDGVRYVEFQCYHFQATVVSVLSSEEMPEPWMIGDPGEVIRKNIERMERQRDILAGGAAGMPTPNRAQRRNKRGR